MRSSAKHAKQTLVDEQAACSRRRCSPLRVLNFVLVAQFIAGDVRTGFAVQAELRRLSAPGELGMRGGDALVDRVVSAHSADT